MGGLRRKAKRVRHSAAERYLQGRRRLALGSVGDSGVRKGGGGKGSQCFSSALLKKTRPSAKLEGMVFDSEWWAALEILLRLRHMS